MEEVLGVVHEHEHRLGGRSEGVAPNAANHVSTDLRGFEELSLASSHHHELKLG